MFDRSGVVSAKKVARTYDHPAYPDMWEVVEQYVDVMAYASRHPDAGSTAVARKFDLPRGRVRTWLDGGAPDVVRGLEIADQHGWLGANFGDPEFSALNALVANVFSGGSISGQNYAVRFALNHRGTDSHVLDAIELAGVEYEIVTDRPDRGDEAVPTEGGSVLGRTLAALGAPVGQKTETEVSLPTYLEDAPEDVRETFVYAYLENRATEHPSSDILVVREQRPDRYLDALADLIGDVADGAKVTRSEKNIYLSTEAVANLGQVR